MMPSPAEKRILNDNISGSSEILANAVGYILDYLKKYGLGRDSISHIIEFCHEVKRRFSSMTMVAGGLDRVQSMLAGYDAKAHKPGDVTAGINGFLSDFQAIDKEIIRNCREIFRKKVSVATYSNSGLVKKVLGNYRSKLKSVFLSEARPALEGRLMAKFLSEQGIRVVYSVDMLLPQLMQQADYFIVGADSVGPSRFVNKIGSAALLKSARESGLKTVVLFESLKVISKDPDQGDFLDKSPKEVWDVRRGVDVKIINRYFEIIPNHLVRFFISDFGVNTPASLKRIIKAGR